MISDTQIIQLTEEEYGLSISKVTQLAGYIDLNFLLEGSDQTKYILKLSTSDPIYFLEAQNKVLEHLANQGNQYPVVYPTRTFDFILEKWGYRIRLLSFLEGTFLADIGKYNLDLVSNFGKTLGEMDTSLAKLELPQLSHMHLDWDISNTLYHHEKLRFVENAEQRRLIHYFLLQFRESVASVIPKLRKSIIQNDANPMNVLVDGDSISGFIDFGDSVFAPTIFNPAIAMSYLMMEQEDPLGVACQFLSAYHEVFSIKESELSILYYVIAARLCTSQLMSAKSRADNPQNEYANIDEQRAFSLMKRLISINPRSATNQFRKACGYAELLKEDNLELLQTRHNYISQSQSISYDVAIQMEKAAMQYMYASDGQAYVDCVNNIMHVGHCHPKVVEASQRQVATMNTNTRYLYDSLNTYAERLLAKLPANLTKIFFVNSGSAASDLAIRLAKTNTGRDDLIVIEQGYHGNTELGIEISSYKFDGKGGAGSKNSIHKISMPDTYRENKSAEEYVAEVDVILDIHDIAAFIGEPILSCGGQLMLPDLYFSSIYKKVRAVGGVCIADETQVGFGRVGHHFWGFELQDVAPDIVIMGKPIGNGHPMAAVACTDEIAKGFENGMEFFSSFGGNPVSCKIGLAVLDVIEEEGLQQHAQQMGEYILEQWGQLKEKYSCIGDVRGVGLFLGIEFVKSRETKEPDKDIAHRIVQLMKERGFLLSTDGPYHNVIKFKPPMVFDKGNADDLYHHLNDVLKFL